MSDVQDDLAKVRRQLDSLVSVRLSGPFDFDTRLSYARLCQEEAALLESLTPRSW